MAIISGEREKRCNLPAKHERLQWIMFYFLIWEVGTWTFVLLIFTLNF